jgi:hypothetical protein
MAVQKLKFYSDPGHGWLAVKRKMLFDLGIADKITPYSYQKGNTVYLEEDCDAPLLIGELKKQNILYVIQEITHKQMSPIRYYDRFII